MAEIRPRSKLSWNGIWRQEDRLEEANIFQLILTVVAIGAVILGTALMRAPRRVIETQIQFYRRINWKMEPLSWEREIRNTRWMGALALLCGVLIPLVVWIRSHP